ncbi:MAG: glutamine synthetase [Sandaracinaceae bacterium]|nr:glutamine synthetase [Sandaracinaceae bacterium]
MTTDLLESLAQRGLRKVKVGGFDVDGLLRGKFIHPDKLPGALGKGFGFCDVIFGWDITDALYDNATVTGWHSGYPDALARVDPSTLRVLPQEPDTAHFLVDFYTPDGKPHPACPRNLLKRLIARAEASGYRPKFGAEFEFWVFRETPQTLEQKSYAGLDPLSPGMFGYSLVRAGQHAEFVHDMLDTLAAYGIPLEGLHTETGPGVWEACIPYDDALPAADKAALLKTTLKLVAARHGLSITFMAKWNAALPGSSGHLHQSLWDGTGETNLFGDPKGLYGLSTLAQHYLAGVVDTGPELTALYAPFVNSYKRYVPGVWAPMTAGWGFENRTSMVRVIGGGGAAGSVSATRLELRQTGADINPYIAMATSLGAGLHGIEQGLSLPPETRGDASSQGRPVPPTLEHAVDALRGSERAKQILGEAFVDHYVRTRDWEAREYRKAVSQWELRRYFEAV